MNMSKAVMTAITLLGIAGTANAATHFNFSSTTNCQGNGGCGAVDGPDGNVRTFSAGGIVLQATGWTTSAADLSAPRTPSWLGQYASGLGVTNPSESGFFNSHVVDNLGHYDFVQFQFPNAPVKILSVTVTPYLLLNLNKDADIAYSFGAWNTAPTHEQGATGYTSRTYAIGESPANGTQLFNVFASLTQTGINDGFKITGLTVEVVPVPAALPLFLSALVGLGLLGRRKD